MGNSGSGVGLDVGGQVDAHLGSLGFTAEVMAGLSALPSITRALRDVADRQQRAAEAFATIRKLDTSASFTTTAAGLLTIGGADSTGPRTGLAWAIHRISIAGLKSSSESALIYKGSTGSSSDAQTNLYVCTITGPNGIETFGKGCVTLYQTQTLVAYNTSLTASETVSMQIEGWEMASWALPYYAI
jgi:hypothetical protein